MDGGVTPTGTAASGTAAPAATPVADPDDDTLLDFDPQWCLFWGKAVTGFHLDIWVPYLRHSANRFVVMAGEDRFSPAVRETIAALPNVRIVEPYALAKAWLKLCPSFQGFLYVGTKAANFDVVNSFGGQSHVWLGHGESDKVYNAFRTASLYDSMFVARYGVLDRYPRAIRGWVKRGACAIGTPILDGATKDPWTSPRPVRTILYAPTWEGHGERADYQSLREVGPILIDALPGLRERGVSVIMRPHPSTGSRAPALREIRDAIFAAGARPGGDKAADFGAADLIISDISGVTAEFLFTEKPALMPVTDRLIALGKDEQRLASEYPWVYRWRVETTSLADRLRELETDDPLRDRRSSAARDMFRGHRSIQEAARSFDLALSSVVWRKTPVPVRWVYEARRRIPLLRDPRLDPVGRRLRRRRRG
jgi:hypothetical protein